MWAGAEVQVASLLREFKKDLSLDVHAILLNRGTLYDRLIAYGIPTQVLDEHAMSSVEITKRLYRFNKEWNPHVVHTHRYKENCLGGLAAARAGIPVIINTVHGIQEALAGWGNMKWRFYSLLAGQVTKRVASGLIGVSLEIASLLRRQFPKLEVVYIPNGIRCDAVNGLPEPDAARKAAGIEAQAFVVGSVGRLTPVKGLEYLLHAAALMVHERAIPSLQVVVVGMGPSRRTLEELAQRLNIGDRVRFLGERHDVPHLLRLFDIFVLPSLHEGIPMALLEALAAGCSVVASGVGGILEVVREGKDGLLVPPRNPRAIADAIQALYASRTLRTRLQQAGPERVAMEFSAERMAFNTKNFYLSLVRRMHS
jgi:glycosyltransferase involved in cell wall biosynthesis